MAKIFKRIKLEHIHLYVEGAERKDAIHPAVPHPRRPNETVNDNTITEVSGIVVGSNGKLKIKNSPLKFKADLVLKLPEKLVSVGFPHTNYVHNGEVYSAVPAMWAILSEEERAELLDFLNTEPHSIVIREFRSINTLGS